MNQLSDKQKREIGQHFVIGFVGQEVTPEIVAFIRDYHVGAIIMMKRNIQDARQLRGLIAKLQSIAKEANHEQPLLIGIDQENGLVSAFSRPGPLGGTQFPGAMALSAIGRPEAAELVYSSSGMEMQLTGINWVYSPVCDINSDPRNPVIGVRSFGDNAEEVTNCALAATKGLTSSGIASSPKHFPGHGDTHVDSHLGLPRILKTREELDATELVPFKALIGLEVATIMTGHMALPLITGDDTPCSLTRKITTDLLRTELGYKGVVVTDCLEMDAVVEAYGAEQGAVEALKAGADIVMICHRADRQKGAIEATYKAILSGELALEQLEESGKRIRDLKKRFAGAWEDVVVPELNMDRWEQYKAISAPIQHRTYEDSMAIVSDANGILPFKSLPETVFVFTPQMETLNRAVDDAENTIRTADGNVRNTAGPSYTAFAQDISKRLSGTSEHIVYGPGDIPPPELKQASAVVFATRKADSSTWQLDYLQSILKIIASIPIVVVATLTPYEVLNNFIAGPDAAYMCTFEYSVESLQAAAAVMFDPSKPLPKGRVPVRAAI
ncbi:glycoside hydrolase [Hysterangium stoloniferum]|nr:glycoside hydrolase [Hysterangium stoloniferum]